MKPYLLQWVILFPVFFYNPVIAQDTIRVPDDYTTIQAAINAASDGDVVLVAEGTYYENLQITSKFINLGSYFLIDGDTTHIEKTIIDGSQPQNTDQASAIRVRWSQAATVISGLTITGGYGTKTPLGDRVGGGINAVRSSITISDCRIINNVITKARVPDTYDGADGGGIGVYPFEYENLSIIIRNNLITDNYVESDMTAGGGIFLSPDRPGSLNFVIENNIIRNNITQNTSEWKAMGGGMALCFYLPTSGTQLIRNNVFINNQARCFCSFGGAMYILIQDSIADGAVDNDPGPFIYNNIFSGNHSDHLGGAIAVWRVYWPIGDNRAWPLTSYGHYTPKPSFINNTFVNNSARDGSAFYIMNHKPLLMNNILWDSLAENAVWGEIFLGNDSVWTSWVEGNTYGDAEVHYTDIQGGWNKGTGNLYEEPRLVEAKFELREDSPCIGTGVDTIKISGINYTCPATCYFGRSRPYPAGSNPDMGACESLLGTPVDILERLTDLDFTFDLAQNYPNPFNPKTVIRYTIGANHDSPVQVDLSIYNLLGQMVATLVSEKQPAGSYKVEWDARNFTSGVYFYGLNTSSGFVQTRKMVVVR